MSPGPLQTDRLTIRAATAEDADTVYDMRTIPSVSQWIPYSAATPRAEFRELYTARLPLLWIIERRGETVGELILRVASAFAQVDVADDARDVEAEIGWLIHPDHQRRGYAFEAVSRLMEHAFTELSLRRLVAEAFAANQATKALAPRLGMRLEATHVKAALHRSEGWVDTVTYAILAEEWLGRH